jgi:hypothetical protein
MVLQSPELLLLPVEGNRIITDALQSLLVVFLEPPAGKQSFPEYTGGCKRETKATPSPLPLHALCSVHQPQS